MLNYKKADKDHAEEVYKLVQETIIQIYPHYYPKEAVEFFSCHHSRESIIEDINKNRVCVLYHNGILAGTGSYEENHITRVYVLPAFQGNGFGSFIMQRLEEEIAHKYETVSLDASLPASRLYERIGYKTVKHEAVRLEHEAVLIYEIMEKCLING